MRGRGHNATLLARRATMMMVPEVHGGAEVAKS